MTEIEHVDQVLVGDEVLVGPDEPQTWEMIRSWGGAGKPIHVHRKGFVVDFKVRDAAVYAKLRRHPLEG